MMPPSRPSDTPDPVRRQCVGSASEMDFRGRRESSASVGPHPYGTDALSEPSSSASAVSASSASDTPTWTPTHESTRDAWEAVTANIRDRQERGLWSSRTIAETIAQHAGLHRARAVDLIRSAIKHGYLEERESPLGPDHTSQVRLAGPMDGDRA
jgi:hypothetical protein